MSLMGASGHSSEPATLLLAQPIRGHKNTHLTASQTEQQPHVAYAIYSPVGKDVLG